MNQNRKFLVLWILLKSHLWISDEREVAALAALKGGDNPHSPFTSGSLCFEFIGKAI